MKTLLQYLIKRLLLEISCNERALLFLPFILILITPNTFAQPGPVVEWQKSYGGPKEDFISAWAETGDGYLLGGHTLSSNGADKTEPSRGKMDYWIIKIDKAGVKQWDKTFGGSENDNLSSIVVTTDGFLLSGHSSSGISGDKTETNQGGIDYWVVKISTNGTKIWDKRFGGTKDDILVKTVKASDGGFVLAGTSYSGKSGDKSEDARTPSQEFGYPKGDFWVVKINSAGVKLWDKTFGGLGETGTFLGDDALTSLISTADGGFLLGGNSNSLAGFEKSEDSKNYDFWTVKISATGTKIWDKSYGTEVIEKLGDIVTAPDGGFILGGYNTIVIDRDEQSETYASEIVLKKINGTGVIQWEKNFALDIHAGTYAYLRLAAYASGFALIYESEQNFEEKYLFNYNWEGLNQYYKKLDITHTISFLNYNSQREAFIGHYSDIFGPNRFQYGLIKFKAEPVNPTPDVHLDFSKPNMDNVLHIAAIPTYVKEPVSKVELYVNNVKIGEDFSLPYKYTWQEKGAGDYKVKAIAYTSSGLQILSKTVDWRVFPFYGTQAEAWHFDVADVGNYPITEEKYYTLNGGSSIRIWDVGDKVRFALPGLVPGKYIIKVRLRSGYYTATSSNPKSYWPNGYSFWINDAPTTFTGDPNSISGRNEAYGGSYWGTMISSEVTLTTHGASLQILANKKMGRN